MGFETPKGGAELRMIAERQPNVRGDQRIRAESVLSNTDNGVGLAVNVKRAADEIGARAHSLPETVAGDHHVNVSVGFAFVGVVKASAKWLRSHQREIIFRGQEREAASHVTIATDSSHGKLECGYVGENVAAVFAQLAVFIVRKLAIIVAGVLA